MSKKSALINNYINKHHNKTNNNYTTSDDTATRSDILYVEPTLFGSGTINPFSTRLITSYLKINSLFRNNYNNTLSTDYIVELPTPLK